MRRSKGFILVPVMLACATLLTAATAFAWFARTEARAAASRENIYKFRGVAEMAVKIASERIKNDSNGFDSPLEELYDPYSKIKMEFENYTAEVQIRPLNDKIALDGLFLPDGVTVRSEYERAWEKIWEALERPRLAAEVLDFLDEDSDQRIGGAERETSINRMISDLSELRAVPEIDDGLLWGTEEIPGGLARYVSVAGGEKLNVNVASPEVLSMLDDELTLSHAQNIAAYRIVNPIRDMDGLRSVPGFPASLASKLANVVGFESTRFLLSVRVFDEAGNERNYRVAVGRSGSGVIDWDE